MCSKQSGANMKFVCLSRTFLCGTDYSQDKTVWNPTSCFSLAKTNCSSSVKYQLDEKKSNNFFTFSILCWSKLFKNCLMSDSPDQLFIVVEQLNLAHLQLFIHMRKTHCLSQLFWPFLQTSPGLYSRHERAPEIKAASSDKCFYFKTDLKAKRTVSRGCKVRIVGSIGEDFKATLPCFYSGDMYGFFLPK